MTFEMFTEISSLATNQYQIITMTNGMTIRAGVSSSLPFHDYRLTIVVGDLTHIPQVSPFIRARTGQTFHGTDYNTHFD
jgi:hypothetical protein